jgi:hypothetical protein
VAAGADQKVLLFSSQNASIIVGFGGVEEKVANRSDESLGEHDPYRAASESQEMGKMRRLILRRRSGVGKTEA